MLSRYEVWGLGVNGTFLSSSVVGRGLGWW